MSDNQKQREIDEAYEKRAKERERQIDEAWKQHEKNKNK